MSLWENNGNGNKCLADVEIGMGLKLMGMEKNQPNQLNCVRTLKSHQMLKCPPLTWMHAWKHLRHSSSS